MRVIHIVSRDLDSVRLMVHDRRLDDLRHKEYDMLRHPAQIACRVGISFEHFLHAEIGDVRVFL